MNVDDKKFDNFIKIAGSVSDAILYHKQLNDLYTRKYYNKINIRNFYADEVKLIRENIIFTLKRNNFIEYLTLPNNKFRFNHIFKQN